MPTVPYTRSSSHDATRHHCGDVSLVPATPVPSSDLSPQNMVWRPKTTPMVSHSDIPPQSLARPPMQCKYLRVVQECVEISRAGCTTPAPSSIQQRLAYRDQRRGFQKFLEDPEGLPEQSIYVVLNQQNCYLRRIFTGKANHPCTRMRKEGRG